MFQYGCNIWHFITYRHVDHPIIHVIKFPLRYFIISCGRLKLLIHLGNHGGTTYKTDKPWARIAATDQFLSSKVKAVFAISREPLHNTSQILWAGCSPNNWTCSPNWLNALYQRVCSTLSHMLKFKVETVFYASKAFTLQ